VDVVKSGTYTITLTVTDNGCPLHCRSREKY